MCVGILTLVRNIHDGAWDTEGVQARWAVGQGLYVGGRGSVRGAGSQHGVIKSSLFCMMQPRELRHTQRRPDPIQSSLISITLECIMLALIFWNVFSRHAQGIK